MSDSTDHQQAVLALAKKKGINMARVSKAQYRMLSIEVRSFGELGKDAGRAAGSFLSGKLKIGVVSLDVIQSNKTVCKSNKCNRYREQHTGKTFWSACDACNCSGKLLDSKWMDSKEHCPLINPETGEYYWDNRKKSIVGESIVVTSPAKDGHG